MNEYLPDSITDPDVRALLQALIPELHALLRRQLVGIYAGGSLAYGGFNPLTSDLDLLVVTSEPLPDDLLPKLAEMHARLAASGLKHANRLEVSYITRAGLRHFDPDNMRFPILHSEGTFDIAIHGSDWIIERHILREYGVLLFGPDPGELIDPVKPDDLRQAVRSTLRDWWALKLDDPSFIRDPEYQVFAVKTMCRALYTLERGEVCSKPEAVIWALETQDARWHDLIRAARDWRPGLAFDRLGEVLDLIRFVTEKNQ